MASYKNCVSRDLAGLFSDYFNYSSYNKSYDIYASASTIQMLQQYIADKYGCPLEFENKEQYEIVKKLSKNRYV